jgi:AAA ATPase domain
VEASFNTTVSKPVDHPSPENSSAQNQSSRNLSLPDVPSQEAPPQNRSSQNPPSQNLASVWAPFRAQFQARALRFSAEYAEAWTDLRSLIESVEAAFNEIAPASAAPASLDSVQAFLADTAERLLLRPMETLRKRQPGSHARSVLEDYESGVRELARALPSVLPVSGSDLATFAGPEAAPGWRHPWLRWQHKAKPFRLRGALIDAQDAQSGRRAELDGAFHLTLAQGYLLALEPWHILRRHVLSQWSKAAPAEAPEVAAETGDGSSPRGATSPRATPTGAAYLEDWQRWQDAIEKHAARTEALLGRLDAWAKQAPGVAARALLSRRKELSRRKRAARRADREVLIGYWLRQNRAVRALLELECQMVALGRGMLSDTEASLQSLQAEHDQLIGELDSVIAWIESSPSDMANFPAAGGRIAGSEQRVQDWLRRIHARAAGILPLPFEVTEPQHALPRRWRSPWRKLEPGRIFARALDHTGREVFSTGLRETEDTHAAIVREIERARETVAFGLESAQAGESAGSEVIAEAFKNASSLLVYRRQSAPPSDRAAELSAVQALACVFLECHVAQEKNRLGQLAYLTRQRGYEALQQSREVAVEAIRAEARRAQQSARALVRLALAKLGLLPPPREEVQPVRHRASLERILDLRAFERDLPAIYRRLFRLAPVEDPRFLVGRDAELAGLAEALAKWEDGRQVTVLLVGARGSGKTSLLNCAEAGVFAGRTVVRGQFRARSADPARLRAALSGILGLPAGTDLAAACCRERRIVIVEELERTFLRVMGGFDGLKELMDLFYTTAAGTLWIFSVNETAYQYLDAVLKIGQHFTHRINAMSVNPEDLKHAILQRHYLSGFRLAFAPLPREDPRVDNLRRMVGLDRKPEEIFFDSLYDQSEGIFRSAFELWQGSIERVEGGVVNMRQPLVPDYGPLQDEVTADDRFLLHAVLQHGSLTPEETAAVFNLGATEAERRMARLAGLQILAPDPGGLGLRVLPEAARFVRSVLHASNLS